MRKGAKRKGGRKAAGKERAEAEEEAMAESSPPAEEDQKKEEAIADSSMQEDQEVCQKEEAKVASSSRQQENWSAEEEKKKKKPARHGKRGRASKKETKKKEEDKPAQRAKRARTTKQQEDEPEYFEEKRSLEDLWKAAFLVGTEWDQLDTLYQFNWDFTNLEEAFEEGGKLYGKRVYVFGCTEAHMFPFEDEIKVFLVPAMVAIESPVPPFDKVGIASVQRGEEIVSMKEMKMDWVPYVPLEKRDRQVDGMKFQIFILGCTQRRAALKHLKEELVKKFAYCLPYFDNPFKKDELVEGTDVDVLYTLEGPGGVVTCQFDYEEQSVEEVANDLIEDGELPIDQKDAFKEFAEEKVCEAKEAKRKAEEDREKAIEEMSEEFKQAVPIMKFYKFYPKPSPDTPDVSSVKSPIINRYYGRAHEVL